VRLLVDTHILLWALAEPARLPHACRAQLQDGANEVMFSAASIWEIAIKEQMGRVRLGVSPADIAEAAATMGFRELLVTSTHAAGVARLPMHHRDPFDRLLVAQALSEPARLVTADRALAVYSDLVQVV
jgi:PIN domain nuclease of toxin-antitoxin system